MFFSEQISGRAAKSLSLASHDEKKRTARGSERWPKQTSSENLDDNGFKFKARHERQQPQCGRLDRRGNRCDPHHRRLGILQQQQSLADREHDVFIKHNSDRPDHDRRPWSNDKPARCAEIG